MGARVKQTKPKCIIKEKSKKKLRVKVKRKR